MLDLAAEISTGVCPWPAEWKLRAAAGSAGLERAVVEKAKPMFEEASVALKVRPL